MSSPTSVSNIPVIRESTFADYPQLSRLESQNGLTTKSYSAWTQLWTGNPIYLSRQNHWPIGWVLQHGDRVVGSFGNIPLLYECGGQNITVAAGRAWVVEPAYRSYAPLLLDRFLQQNADLCLSTTASLEASRILEALGAKPVPVGEWDRSEIWITNHRAFARAWLSKRRLPSAFSYVLGPALFLKTSMGSTLRTSIREVDVTRCGQFDERFDEFWERLRKQRIGSLLAVRTRQLLEWHFRSALDENRLWIVAATCSGSILAYALFLEQENRDCDMRQLLLADFQALQDEDDLLFAILAPALKQCQREGIHLVEKMGLCIGNREIIVAPHLRRRKAWSYYYKSNNSSLTAFLDNPQVWSPSLLDGDSTL